MQKPFVSPLLREKHHCIVIGAGLAGLAAAYRLSQRGWKVDVFEAHSRLGGRVFSHHFEEAPHLVCELGGEWIGEDHSAMRRLASEFKLELLRHQYSFFFWNGHSRSRMYRPGDWSFSQESAQEFEKFKKEFRGYTPDQWKHLDQFDWWTCLRLRGFTDDELRRRDLMDSTDFGESIRHTSAYMAASEYFESDAYDEMDSKIVGGNERLIHALADSIGRDCVRTNARVTGIVQRGERVTVVLESGAKHSADVCICTIPALSLGEITWDPPLPTEHQDAANQLQYSRILKSAVLCEKQFWPTPEKGGFSVFTSRASDFCFDSTYRQEQGKGAILCSYAIGEKADDLAAEPDETDVMKWIVEDAYNAMPVAHESPRPIRIQRQPWQRMKGIGGAYAFYRPGQWFTIRPILQQAHDRVLFAGEHLADWQGFMEGAVNTGEAAADLL